MSETFHGCHTHLWESPHVLNWQLSCGQYETELSRTEENFSTFHLSQDTFTFPNRVACLPTPNRECLPSLILKSMVIQEQVLSQY